MKTRAQRRPPLAPEEWAGVLSFNRRLRRLGGNGQKIIDYFRAGVCPHHPEFFLNKCPGQAATLENCTKTGSDEISRLFVRNAPLRFSAGLLYHGTSDVTIALRDGAIRPGEDDIVFTPGVAVTRVPHTSAHPFLHGHHPSAGLFVLDAQYYNAERAKGRALIDQKKNNYACTPQGRRCDPYVSWHTWSVFLDPIPLDHVREIWVWEHSDAALHNSPSTHSEKLRVIPTAPSPQMAALNAVLPLSKALLSYQLRRDLWLQIPTYEAEA